MTVKQLIAELKKMPQGASVYLADHDHSLGETNGPADSMHLLTRDEADEHEANSWPDGCLHIVVISV